VNKSLIDWVIVLVLGMLRIGVIDWDIVLVLGMLRIGERRLLMLTMLQMEGKLAKADDRLLSDKVRP